MAALNLITFADAAGSRVGVLLDGGRVLDLGVAMPPARDMISVIEAGAPMLAAIRALAANPPANAVLPLASVALQAPIPKPRRNVFCVGRNYMDHVAEGDRTRGITASEIVNTYAPGALVKILRAYGEEKFATRIVENIVKARAKAPLNSTQELATLVKESIPAATRRTGGNPAKRTFQALRIEANDELGAITRALPVALDLLMVGGRVVVLSFQSLEDRLVKEFMRREARDYDFEGPEDHPDFRHPRRPRGRELARKGIAASESELSTNPRARSARLRVLERLPEP